MQYGSCHAIFSQTDNYQPLNSKIKIAVVGNKFTGKTQLIMRIVEEDFSCQYNADLSFIKVSVK